MSLLSDPITLKPIIAFALSISIDRYYYGVNNIKSSMLFAGAVSGSFLISSLITPGLPNLFPNLGSFADGSDVQERILDVSISEIACYIINDKILRNNFYQTDDTYMRIANIILIDVASEYITDYLSGQRLSYLTN